ncbi:unnamed protein product [Rhizopus stolonifer]
MSSLVTEIEQHVSKMLQATKKLLELLTGWSSGEVKEDEIYQEYNALQSHFLQTAHVFERTLAMDDMLHLPDKLFDCLKSTLASGPESLEHHLPLIKQAILNLLSSIKKKQAELPKLLSPATSQIDLNDPLTQQAIQTLASQEDLVERSFVRKHIHDIYIKSAERIKKVSVSLDDDLDLTRLKALFKQHFDQTCSEIYILDPVSNVEYELESMADVKPYSILSSHDTNPIVFEMRSILEKSIQTALENYRSIDESPLRQEIIFLKRTHETYRQETQQLLTELAGRKGIEEAQHVIKSVSELLTSRLERLQDDVDQLKQDITQRRCRPSKNRLRHCQTESEWLLKEMQELETRIKNYRPIWKKMWEAELQQIVKEQQFLKSQEVLWQELEDDYRSIQIVLEQATQISDIHERKKQQRGLEFKVVAIEGFDGMSSVMKEVESIRVDHERRLRALDEAERARSRALAQSIDAFERELIDFVCLKKLKKTGGPEQVDKQREIIDKAIMRQMFSNKKL